MSKIKQLSKHLINLIAAGEVIERPMNVVKELVENSLDANSHNITINLLDCGIKQIEVIDDGDGISKDELPIALMKHTTSKIFNEDDLFQIVTLGFRGEALASIASVSDFTIYSNNGETNYYLHKKADQLVDEGLASINKGTRIVVKNLFYNTPARYKNLANQYVELAQTEEMIQKLALANPLVSFKLTNNDKVLLQTDGKNLTSIMAEIYGAQNTLKMIDFSATSNLYTISGMCSNNEVFRSNRTALTVICNHRVIKNYSIIKAILDAYQTILPVGKYPIVLLNIKCSPDSLDVNVHPSKLEIRFTNESELKNLITNTLKEALINSELLKYQKADNSSFHEEEVLPYDAEPNKKDEFNDALNDEKEQEESDPFNSFHFANIKIIEPQKEIKKTSVNIQTIDQLTKRHFFTTLHYIGQYNLTYLIMENEGTLYIIDQHAAMERVMYEKIKKAIFNAPRSQTTLIVPIELTFSQAEVAILMNKLESFALFQIDCEKLLDNSIIIRKIPTWIPNGMEMSYLNDICNALLNNEDINKSDVLDDLIKQMSCKKSIKANMAITIDEINSLMQQLDECIMPYSCPHGRPTIIKFTNNEIEKMFKRINQ